MNRNLLLIIRIVHSDSHDLHMFFRNEIGELFFTRIGLFLCLDLVCRKAFGKL